MRKILNIFLNIVLLVRALSKRNKRILFALSVVIILIMAPVIVYSLLRLGKAEAFSATGGTITYSGGYTIHTFTTSGTFTPDSSGTVEYLVVGGGGSGGASVGGGGGAGGFRTATGFAVTAQAYTVTVGAGGSGPAQESDGNNGSNSVFSTITSTGGGKGSGGANGGGFAAGNGGSGGGGNDYLLNNPDTQGPGTGTGGQGNNGGSAGTDIDNGGAGGGGASAVGQNITALGGGDGGAGTASSISGSSVTYAGGGGGVVWWEDSSRPWGTGGAGGGGNSAQSAGTAGSAGTANTGGGGGGGWGYSGGAGGAGGSGIVIIRYPTPDTAPLISSPTKTPIHGSDATLGGDVTSDGGDTITGRGVCVGASSNPALGGNCFSTSGTTGVFTVSATSLTQNTLYHYRAYATNSVGTSYTTDDTFTTLALDNYLVTIVTPQTAGVCATGTNSVTARDSTNTTITTDTSTVDMTSSGTGVTFYTTSGCSSSTTQYTLSSGVANIYYKTNKAQSFTITATKNGSSETGTSSSITVNANSQTRLVITLPSQTFTDGSGNSGSVTNQIAGVQFTITKISATDDYFNVITSYSGAKTLAYSGPSSSMGAPSYTTSVSFTNGQSTTTLNTILYTPETTTITVTDGGSYGYASSSLTINARGINIRGKVEFRGKVDFQP